MGQSVQAVEIFVENTIIQSKLSPKEHSATMKNNAKNLPPTVFERQHQARLRSTQGIGNDSKTPFARSALSIGRPTQNASISQQPQPSRAPLSNASDALLLCPS